MTTLKSNIEDPITPPKICKHILPDLRIKYLSPLSILNAFKLIRNFDNHTANKNFKFGVIYMRKGQVRSCVQFGVFGSAVVTGVSV